MDRLTNNALSLSKNIKMPAVKSLMVSEAYSTIAKRSNWAGREAGVIVVFAIVFVVAVGLSALFIHKKLAARKAAKAQF